MTTARLQKTMVVAVLLGCGLWVHELSDRPLWAVGVACLPLAIMALGAALQFALLAYINDGHQSDTTPRRSLWGVGFREWCISVQVFAWWQPFRSQSIPDNLPHTSVLRGVVLVHGYFCNRGFWSHWLRRLANENRAYVAVNLEPTFGSIDDYVQTIESAVARVTLVTGLPPVIVAHSMGGLAVRAWLVARLKDSHEAAAPVRRVVTLGTPHQGTWLARLGFSKNTQQMREHNDWLKALEHAESHRKTVEFVCYFSDCDNIVFPVLNATLAGAENRALHGLGHVAMVHDAAVMEGCWKLMV
jgi:triacylglycerol lipase